VSDQLSYGQVRVVRTSSVADIGAVVCKVLQASSWTLSGVARKLGVTVADVERWEQEECRNLSPVLMDELTALLGLEVHAEVHTRVRD
jgi:hypothetical protein